MHNVSLGGPDGQMDGLGGELEGGGSPRGPLHQLPPPGQLRGHQLDGAQEALPGLDPVQDLGHILRCSVPLKHSKLSLRLGPSFNNSGI